MIILILDEFKTYSSCGRYELPGLKTLVSHGVCTKTDQVVILSNEGIDYYKAMGAYFCEHYDEWVLPDEDD